MVDFSLVRGGPLWVVMHWWSGRGGILKQSTLETHKRSPPLLPPSPPPPPAPPSAPSPSATTAHYRTKRAARTRPNRRPGGRFSCPLLLLHPQNLTASATPPHPPPRGRKIWSSTDQGWKMLQHPYGRQEIPTPTSHSRSSSLPTGLNRLPRQSPPCSSEDRIIPNPFPPPPPPSPPLYTYGVEGGLPS